MNTGWQHVLVSWDPVAFSIGFFTIRWYGVCFLLGVAAVWFWLRFFQQRDGWLESQETLEQVFVTVLVGALLGARLGYVFVYAPAYFWQYPWAILSPWDPLTGQYTGLSGLSFHGALLGASVALCVWARIQKLPLLLWADRISVVLPLGIFFGRLGNFLNGELWGRPTDVRWGVYFPHADVLLRHPSPLYEAGGEGLGLFLIMLWLRRYIPEGSGQRAGSFLVGYGSTRFLLEFFREPDQGIGYLTCGFTLGQLLSLGLVVLAVLWLIWRRQRENMVY